MRAFKYFHERALIVKAHRDKKKGRRHWKMTKIVTTNWPLFATSRRGGIVFKIDPVVGNNRENRATRDFQSSTERLSFPFSFATNLPRRSLRFRTATRLHSHTRTCSSICMISRESRISGAAHELPVIPFRGGNTEN